MLRYENIHGKAKGTAESSNLNREQINDNAINKNYIEGAKNTIEGNLDVEPLLAELERENTAESSRLADERTELENTKAALSEKINEELNKVEIAQQALNSVSGNIAEAPVRKVLEVLKEKHSVLIEAKKLLEESSDDICSNEYNADNVFQLIDKGSLTNNFMELLPDTNVERESEKVAAAYFTGPDLYQTTIEHLAEKSGGASDNQLAEFPGLVDIIFSFAEPYYLDARQIATNDKDNKGQNFTLHTGEHVKQVAEKSLEIIQALVMVAPDWNQNASISNPNIVKFAKELSYDEKKILAIAALLHDIGMSGGYFYKENESPRKIDLNSNDVYLNEIRPNHSLNSALQILINRDNLKSSLLLSDTEIYMVAVLCFSHSKSNSGLTDVNDSVGWNQAFSKIESVVNQYNKDHPEKQIAGCEFDRLNKRRNLSVLATLAYALRVGDVSRDSSVDDFTQSWDFVHVYQDTIDSEVDIKVNSEKDLKLGTDQEVINAQIERGILQEPVTDLKSKAIHVGEQNIVNNRTYVEDGKMVHEVTVSNIDYAPYSTATAITEHLGEFASSALACNIEIRIISQNGASVNDRLISNIRGVVDADSKYSNKFKITHYKA